MTRSATFTLLGFALLTFALAGPARADEKALKELEGTYKLVLAERDGKPAEKASIETVTVTIKGDEFVMTFSADDKKTAKIKATADPKLSTIELSPQDGPEKGKTFPGIYKIEKGEVTLAFSEKGERPKEFKSDNEAILLRLKKVEK
jgi:uncharacterized protein (TIGR03067 family)